MTDFRSLSYTSASEIPSLSGAPHPRPPPESLLTPPGDTGEATDEYRDRRNETHLSDSVKLEIRKRIFLLYITVGYLTHCPSTKEYFKVFFLNWYIDNWNSLPSNIVEADNVINFKKLVYLQAFKR